MTNDILQKLNAQHVSTAPAETDQSFVLSLRNVFTCLAPDGRQSNASTVSTPSYIACEQVNYRGTKRAEWLSERAKALSEEIFQVFCAIRDENRSPAQAVSESG